MSGIDMELNWKSLDTRDRFIEAIALLCAGAYPPEEMIDAWLDSDDERLQTWCVNEAGLSYLTGISIIEAAHMLVEEAFGNANIDAEGNRL
jgi:hypothetical protein